MKIYIESQNKKIELKFNGKASELIKKLKISQESILIIRNDELITDDEKLDDKDEIKILSVVSGG